jgi:hypothetical protein
MLKNRYQEIIIGLNLMSLVRGLVSLRRNRSILLIDDQRFEGASYFSDFLSELEIRALLRLGKKHDVPELQNLRNFTTPATFEFIFQDKRLRLGGRPYENLRELLRKYPELIESSDLDLVYGESPDEFDRYLLEELQRYEGLLYEASSRPKGVRFELIGPKWMKGIYQRFNHLLNREYSASKDLKYQGLLHLLGVSAEEKLKTQLAPEDVAFYFFRLLSPIYRLHDFFLTTQLKRRLTLEGGDYKESSIQYWQLYDNKFENLLLASFEGVVSGSRVLFFSHLPADVSFQLKSPYPIYRKCEIVPVKRAASPWPPHALRFIGQSELLGSERPYRVLSQGENGFARYHWPYLELPASKAEFYYQEASEAFKTDSQWLGLEQVEHKAAATARVTLDLRQMRDKRKSESQVLNPLPLSIVAQDAPIQGFEYWGPFRYQSLGLLALCYGVEEI